jgi:hypothetical protein
MISELGTAIFPFLAVVCPLFGGAASAGDYWLVASNERQIVLIDPSRIDRGPDGFPRAWVAMVRRSPSTAGKRFDYLQTYQEFDCNQFPQHIGTGSKERGATSA